MKVPSDLNLATGKQATEAGLYRGDMEAFYKNLADSGFDGVKMKVDGETNYLILNPKPPSPLGGPVAPGRDVFKEAVNAFSSYKRQEDPKQLLEFVANNPKEAAGIAKESRDLLSSLSNKYLYRGGDGNGMSWTTDKAVAEQFAKNSKSGELFRIELTPKVIKNIFWSDRVVKPAREFNSYESEFLLKNAEKLGSQFIKIFSR